MYGRCNILIEEQFESLKEKGVSTSKN
jgi:hypothetical protein